MEWATVKSRVAERNIGEKLDEVIIIAREEIGKIENSFI